MPLYLYTVRRARLTNIDKYVGLIPKLFSDMFDDGVNIKSGCDTNNRTQVKLFENDITALTIFTNMLHDNSNILHNSTNIDNRDIDTIIRLNIKLYLKNEHNHTYDKFIKFIEHLYRGHNRMDYGLYFGCMRASDDRDLLLQIERNKVSDSDQRVILYIQLEKMLDHIDTIKTNYFLYSPLLYFSTRWLYGKMNNLSKIYEKDNRKQFIAYLETYSNVELQHSETICQIPLPISKFKYTFGNIPYKQ